MDILLGMHLRFDLCLYLPRLPLQPTIPNLTLSMLAWTKPLHLDQNYVPTTTSYVAYRLHPEVFLPSMKVLNNLTKSLAFPSLSSATQTAQTLIGHTLPHQLQSGGIRSIRALCASSLTGTPFAYALMLP